MWQRMVVQVVLGAVLGYVWHRVTLPLTGGGCPLTCSPWRAMLLGAAVGLLWPAKAPVAASGGLDVTRLGTKEAEMTTETMTPGAPVPVSEATFAALVQAAKTPILLDAYADWCGPCRRLAPELEAVANSLAGRLVVAKLNVDENMHLAQQLGIRGIPALFLIDGGQVRGAWTGYATAEDIKARVQPHLSAE